MSMEKTQCDEQQRILEMVQSGTVTPEEGARLLASLEQRSRGRRPCPYCAESIPSDVTICPECSSTLGAHMAPAAAQQNGNGFHALSGLGKFLVCYTFLICGIMLLRGLFHFSLSMALAGLGIIGAALICKGSRAGWKLATLWAGIQMIPIAVNGIILNQQLLNMRYIQTTNGSGIGFNLVGLILLILFIKTTPPATDPYTQTGR
jgi:hypothetical protein